MLKIGQKVKNLLTGDIHTVFAIRGDMISVDPVFTHLIHKKHLKNI